MLPHSLKIFRAILMSALIHSQIIAFRLEWFDYCYQVLNCSNPNLSSLGYSGK